MSAVFFRRMMTTHSSRRRYGLDIPLLGGALGPVFKTASKSMGLNLNDLPTEILTVILIYVARDDDDSAYSVIAANDHLNRICRVSRRLRSVCLGYGPAWCNIPLSFSQWGPPVGVPTLIQLRARLTRSGDGPIRICFNLPVSANDRSVNEGTALWAELLLHKRRWTALHLQGPSKCDAYVSCAKSLAFGASFGQSTPKLTAVTLLTRDGAPGATCPVEHRGQAAIRVFTVVQIITTVPISLRPAPTASLVNYPPITHLVYLDIGVQRALVCTTLLASSPNLRTLVWRNNEVGPHFPAIEAPSLVQLILFSVLQPPPIRARNLSEFVVKDRMIPLQHSTFSSLTGSSTSRLSHLTLGDHDVIKNEDLTAIFSACRNITKFSFPSGQARTECFRILGTRVVSSYIYDSSPRLQTINFPGRPTREPGIEHHDFLVHLGILESEFRLILHPALFRVRCGPCKGRFAYRNTDFIAQFKAVNRFGAELVCMAIYEEFYGTVVEDLPETFSVILVFSCVRAARDCLARGVVFRGSECEYVVSFHA